jgi:hypothetical protein
MPTDMHASEPPYHQVIKPHVKRGVMMSLLWSIGLGLFLSAQERLIIFDPKLHAGMVANVMAPLIVSVTVQCVNWSGLYTLGLWFWRHSQAAHDRHARDGIHAILPHGLALLWLVIATILGTCIGYRLWLAIAQWASIGLPATYQEVGLRMTLLLAIFSTVVLGVIDVLVVRAGLERTRIEAAQRQLVQAQLQRLQAQMEPHMLFNTLANLHALIETGPDRAQDMLLHLIDYLRATLTATRSNALALGDEMARVRDYLVLIQIRMGDRLRLEIDVPAELAHVQIPPMLIQPLVENAIKHGLDPMLEGGLLRVSVRRHEGMIEIQVQDDGQGLYEQFLLVAQPGFGLACIKERLQTCYGSAGQFTLTSLGTFQGAVATLRLPLTMPN